MLIFLSFYTVFWFTFFANIYFLYFFNMHRTIIFHVKTTFSFLHLFFDLLWFPLTIKEFKDSFFSLYSLHFILLFSSFRFTSVKTVWVYCFIHHHVFKSENMIILILNDKFCTCKFKCIRVFNFIYYIKIKVLLIIMYFFFYY